MTKVMTAYLVLRLMERFNIDDETLITVGQDASNVNGTSAELVEGDTLTI